MTELMLHLGTDDGRRVTEDVANTLEAIKADGAVYTGHWAAMEMDPDAYDFASLEQFLSDCERYRVKVRGLRLMGGGKNAPSWAIDGSPIATVGGQEYVVEWAAPLYTDRLYRFTEKVGQYSRYFAYLQPPIGPTGAEMILPDDAAPGYTNFTPWHLPETWEPMGQPGDGYTVARHAGWVADLVEHCLDTWPQTTIQVMVNRQGLDDLGRKAWTRLTGNPPAVPHPAEKAAAAVLDRCLLLAAGRQGRLLAGWTSPEEPEWPPEAEPLLEQIAYRWGPRDTCFDMGRPRTADAIQGMWQRMQGLGATVVRAGPQDVAGFEEVYAVLPR